VSAPLALVTWEEIEAAAPVMAATMRRYLQQIACSLRPGSVTGVELGLRSFAGFLLETHPDVTTVAAVTRAHIEAYKPWLAARPGQRVPRLTVNTRAHRLGTLRMFFARRMQQTPGCSFQPSATSPPVDDPVAPPRS
jgi:hypothetical protein